ncbi:hypothetical protein, partial [Paenibacillus sp. FSL H8-0548]|uniref:hypothetical protein n=1 Tax=Paenibacillus sp. FSL H8-0548 TaxID=1920422 RepID=UPI001C4B2E37
HRHVELAKTSCYPAKVQDSSVVWLVGEPVAEQLGGLVLGLSYIYSEHEPLLPPHAGYPAY